MKGIVIKGKTFPREKPKFSESIFFLKMLLLFRNVNSRTTFTTITQSNFEVLSFLKMYPIFDSSLAFEEYEKITWLK